MLHLSKRAIRRSFVFKTIIVNGFCALVYSVLEWMTLNNQGIVLTKNEVSLCMASYVLKFKSTNLRFRGAFVNSKKTLSQICEKWILNTPIRKTDCQQRQPVFDCSGWRPSIEIFIFEARRNDFLSYQKICRYTYCKYGKAFHVQSSMRRRG